MRAGLQGLDVGIPEGWPEYVLHQMVTVMREGAGSNSQRAGSYVTLRDLIDWVGCDATRYFLVRAPTSQLTFDVDLALARVTRILSITFNMLTLAVQAYCAKLQKLRQVMI